jgi:hypothetical protein
VTDANGRFQIDSIPPGEHSLTVVHPLLDTLNVAITTRPVAFTANNSLTVEMAVPSSTTVIAIHCTAAWRNRGPSALVGKVLDADNDTPLVGAKVSLVWQQLSLTTLRKEPVVRSAVVAADGSYKICGLPGGIDGTAQAEFNGRKTADVRVVMDDASPLAGSFTLDERALAWLELFSEDIAAPVGHLTGTLAVAGTRALPEFSGPAKLARFEAEPPGLGVGLGTGVDVTSRGGGVGDGLGA